MSTSGIITKFSRSRLSSFFLFGLLFFVALAPILFLLPQNVYAADVALAPDLNQTDLDGLITKICKIPLLLLTSPHKISLLPFLLWIVLAINRLMTRIDFFVSKFHLLFRVNRRSSNDEVRSERRGPRDVRVPFYLPKEIYYIWLMLFIATCLVRCGMPVKIPL
ncbi:MAG: hypothetical protein BA865_09180 [Desulfobacterales bacterium S5133MH4]|nr:MAG: hypothetical protein BA865_09180 [Desulfobacterales bacterium S5133MH4]